MLEDLLEISRYEAGQTSLNPDLCDACDLVRNVVQQVAQIARTRGVSVNALLPDHKIMMTVDASRCSSILRNLVNNAIDFAEDNPVQLRLAASEHTVVFSVRDWGTGIAPEDLTHIFERFWRADPSRSRLTGGTGLGLSIALDNTNLMHGLLEVRSQVGQGTWFLLTLPRNVSEQLDKGSVPVRFQTGQGLDVEGSFEEAAS